MASSKGMIVKSCYWIAVFIFILSRSLEALYSGNPVSPALPEKGVWIPDEKPFGLKIGYQGDWVFNRRMEVHNKKSSLRRRVSDFEYQLHQGVIALNILNRFEAYMSFGAMDIEIDQKPRPGIQMHYDTHWNFAFGGGGRLILIFWKHVLLGIDAKALHGTLNLSRIRQSGVSRKPGNSEIAYREWQISGSLGREFGIFAPYAGVAISSANARFKNLPKGGGFAFNPRNETLRNRTHAAGVIGCGLTPGAGLVINVEARVFGEIGLAGSIDFRF